MDPIQVVLASESPRRQEMLRELGIPFTVHLPRISEIWGHADDPVKTAIRLAQQKAKACDDESRLVIAMDTLVVVGKRILGKPGTRTEAIRMLKMLSARKHRVITGVALRHRGRLVSGAESTDVWIRRLGAGELKWYVDSGEPFDKAGGYAIQGLARIFITKIEGCYFNVIGFPIGCFQRLLKKIELSILDLAQPL